MGQTCSTAPRKEDALDQQPAAIGTWFMPGVPDSLQQAMQQFTARYLPGGTLKFVQFTPEIGHEQLREIVDYPHAQGKNINY